MKHPLVKVSTFGACHETRQFSTTVDQEDAEGSMGNVFVGSFTHSGRDRGCVCFASVFMLFETF
ncbi:hypothetical protein F2Q68_00024969 [Brassica cretica]|uniref:Uncharacterized protein n=2 Tax=Brassica cretica TaxID=69181 RepID=A0A8S9IA91_BRACR|nr:hypothetical protein F2Q68_00024969 [Brassica cretica]KAF3605359.1 hypothetical protein DY000_02046772 [Brassica cretica]